jgi:hypothetical protein
MGDVRGDLPLDDLLNLASPDAAPAYRLIEPTLGTPEHAALVAAIRREFPEVYDPKTPACKAD